MSGSHDAHQVVSEIMRQHALGASTGSGTEASLAAEHAPAALPLRTVYVDSESGVLVVGLDQSAQADRHAHERAVRAIAGGADFEVRYVSVRRDACPDKKQDCRPLRGGVRMNGDATLNLVIIQQVNGGRVVQTIASSHAVGAGTGQSVGQAPKSSTYGKVIANPSLADRASDSALTDITNQRIEGSPYTIWRGPNVADYIVNDFAISANTPENLVVYMQGAMQDDVQPGRLIQKGVTIIDNRGRLTNQVYAGYTATGGDSGAPIFYRTEFDGYVVYVGIHGGRVVEAGNTVSYYSPWEGIRDDLGLAPVR